MTPNLSVFAGSFLESHQMAAEKENTMATVRYEKALAMLGRVRAKRWITPREFEAAKEQLYRRFFPAVR